jgi:hypothetical protein
MKCTSLQALAVMLVMAVAAPVAAEEPSSPRSSPFSTQALQRVVRDASAGASTVRLSRHAAAQAQAKGGRRDSVLNGGLIGAAIGAVAGPYLLVRATHGTDDYRKVMLKLAPFTALAGFGIGIGIDGMM